MEFNLTEILRAWADQNALAGPLRVHRWEDSETGPIDRWAGIEVDPLLLQSALDDLVVWPLATTPPTGQDIFDQLATLNAAIATAATVLEIVRLNLAISKEAERRIAEGADITGFGHFKTDNDAMVRLAGMLRAAELDEAASRLVDIRFKTAAGDSYAITSAAEAQVIYEAASNHVMAQLARSDQLQTDVAALSEADRQAFDATDPANWP